MSSISDDQIRDELILFSCRRFHFCVRHGLRSVPYLNYHSVLFHRLYFFKGLTSDIITRLSSSKEYCIGFILDMICKMVSSGSSVMVNV